MFHGPTNHTARKESGVVFGLFAVATLVRRSLWNAKVLL
jgi:hypothetical protein